MAKRTVYIYRDRNVCVVPTAKVEQLKSVAEQIFQEYRQYKARRGRQLDRKIKALARLLYIWTRHQGWP